MEEQQSQTSGTPDLEKLRRFTLAIALVLLTYSLAGIQPKPEQTLTIFGFEFGIEAVEWLPVGLWLACFLSGVRFWYYSVALSNPPWRVRRGLLMKFQLDTNLRSTKTKVGAFSVVTDEDAQGIIELQRKNVGAEAIRLSRKFRTALPHVSWTSGLEPIISDAEITQTSGKHIGGYSAHLMGFTYPWPLRLAVWGENIDYSSPIWLSALACLAGGWKMFEGLL